MTRHGRATPLLWQTVEKVDLAGRRNAHEDRLLERLADCLPDGVRVTVVADRGFGDQKRYEHLRSLKMDYVIRFREAITVTDQWGTAKPASEWMAKSGRATIHKDMTVTTDCFVVPAVVVVRDKKMAKSWCLVRLAKSSFRVPHAEVSAVQGGAATWGRRVARLTEPLVECVG